MQIKLCFILNRVPIEFLNKKFFTGKPESLWYYIYRRDLFLNGTSVAKRSIQLSYRRKTLLIYPTSKYHV